LLVSIVVLSLSLFAQYFGSEYMYREAFISRLLYLLNMFITSVAFLFIVFDFFLVLVVWELIGLFSLLLVNYYYTRVYTLKAALKTFLLSRLSDMFIFFSFLFFIIFFYSTDFSVIFLKVPFFVFYTIYVGSYGVNLLSLIAVLIVLSGSVKAAQFLFHTWLPDAMEAPTPASALIHSSTLVIMGIYFVIRFGILFELSVTVGLLLSLIGSVTIAFGALSATFQNDIKKLVAYSTISQMGYLFCGCGFLCFNEVIFYLAIHALNKAFLFILVGYIVHFFNGNTDLRFMGALYFYSIDIVFILIFVSFNLMGLPYTSGFVAKEFLLFQTFKDGFITLVIRTMWFVSFFFTPVYMLILNLMVVFYSKSPHPGLYVTTSATHNVSKFVPKAFINANADYSAVLSKLTLLVLALLFIISNFFGEFFFSTSLPINTLTLSSNFSSLSLILVDSASLSLLFSSDLLSYVNFLVIFLFLSGMRYLRNLVLGSCKN
jgi:NADH:ubiquinone oxidoreductase subunit 5 (subunit L)/multisubunit Na+/H+ antiporter MnhA subunit